MINASQKPLVSIIVPTRNIAKTLETYLGFINQASYEDFKKALEPA